MRILTMALAIRKFYGLRERPNDSRYNINRKPSTTTGTAIIRCSRSRLNKASSAVQWRGHWPMRHAIKQPARQKMSYPRKRPAHPNTTPKDQTLLTADTPYSAAAPLYQQSVVKAQQRIELGHHAAFNQAAERKASERKGMSQINAREGLDGQYSRSVSTFLVIRFWSLAILL
ncbi:hypothetical protein U1Q18_044799 [Sarracenia purpurea var. burkii]